MTIKTRTALLQSVSIIIGGIIGSGILGLPYAFAQNGFYYSLALLVGVGLSLMTLRIFYGEATLRTAGNHQLPGYVEKYLGKYCKHLASLVIVVGAYGALLTYTIGQGEVLSSLFGGPQLAWGVGAYAVLSLGVIGGLRTVKSVEFLLTVGLFFILMILSLASVPYVAYDNISLAGPGNWFLVYGVALFACSGLVVIPEAKEILSPVHKKRLLLNSILFGSLLPVAFYILFTSLVVGVTGSATTEVAIVGLGRVLGPVAALGGSLFAVFAMSTSFLVQGLSLEELYRYDYRLSRRLALVFSVTVPAVLYLLGLRNFVQVMSFVGALSVGLTGLFTLAVFWAARRKGDREPEYAVPLWFAYPATLVLAAMLLLAIVFVFR